MHFAFKSLLPAVALLGLFTACSKDEAGPTGSIKGQIQYNQTIGQVEITAANGKVLTTTPNVYGVFKISGVPAGPVTVKCIPNPTTFPAVYFPPQPKPGTVAAGDTLDLRVLYPFHTEAVSGTISWTINGQQYQGQLQHFFIEGDPTLPPRLALLARTAGGSLDFAVAGLTGSNTYSTRSHAYINYYDSSTRVYYTASYTTNQGSVVLTTYDPVSRRLAGTLQFQANGVHESSNIPSGNSVVGSAVFDMQL